ncbi:MAG TPA: single-stranded DNA-binding protein [Candidatus Dormibacteraeota bacterium]|nr:single-stranded DNA-binding protein [Candidatus Dormibacteraeota bacterium]
MNVVVLIGRLGADPDLRYTAGGRPVARLSLATRRRRRDQNGDWQEVTDWHRVVVFGDQAESVGQHLVKGQRVGVEGRLRPRTWEAPDGQRRTAVEVVATRVEFLNGPGRRPRVERSSAGDGAASVASRAEVGF